MENTSLTTIIGLDPSSYRNIGWCVVVMKEGDAGLDEIDIEAGTLAMDDVQDPWRNLWPTFYFTDGILEKTKPDLVIIEKTSSFSGGFVTGQVSNSIGCILAACGKNKTNVQFVYPTHVKKIIAGKGRATKSEMKKSVKDLIKKFTGEDIKLDSEHAYDALANVFCWLLENKVLGDTDVAQ